MNEFWYGFIKPKYGEKAKLYYVDIYFFILYIKTDNIYKEIAKHVENRFDTYFWSNWINERWIRWKNHDKIFWITTKMKTKKQ